MICGFTGSGPRRSAKSRRTVCCPMYGIVRFVPRSGGKIWQSVPNAPRRRPATAPHHRPVPATSPTTGEARKCDRDQDRRAAGDFAPVGLTNRRTARKRAPQAVRSLIKPVTIVPALIGHVDTWAALRAELWPDSPAKEHKAEIEVELAAPVPGRTAFVAIDGMDEVAGFAEASVRRDYVNGCDTSPVAFLEGIYITPAYRRMGVAQMLCRAVEQWGRAAGCTELASDSDIENTHGHAFHAAIGFEETERVVFFRKPLAQPFSPD